MGSKYTFISTELDEEQCLNLEERLADQADIFDCEIKIGAFSCYNRFYIYGLLIETSFDPIFASMFKDDPIVFIDELGQKLEH